MLSKIKQAAQSVHRGRYAQVRRNGLIVPVGPNTHHCRRFYVQYKFGSGARSSFLWPATRESLNKCCSLRNFSVSSASNEFTHHSQIAWKRLLYKKYCSNGDSTFSPTINMIAQALSLALTRSYLLVPGILAVACGKLALSQERYPSHEGSYMLARDGYNDMFTFKFKIVEGIAILARALYLFILFSRCIVTVPFVYFEPNFWKLWGDVICRTLEKAGPVFIKLGQWIATRPDIFHQDLCDQLSKLQSKAPEHSFSYTKKTIEKAFNRKISEIFVNFEVVPVASGSIAQVHRATLKYRYPGKQAKPLEVAVKVRHPDVGESIIRRDLAIINTLSNFLMFIPALKGLRLDECVQQFKVFMMFQIDLTREAANLNRFIYNFRSWKDVSFPKPVYPLVHPEVLVETYEMGESVSHYVDGFQGGHEHFKSAIAHIGTNAFLKMVLVDNFIHADMHPGNILVRSTSSKWLSKSKPHVIFLDVGMTAELSRSDRVNLLEFFKSVARRNGRTAAECVLSLSKKQRCPNPQAFIEEMEEAFTFWGTPEGLLVHPADCLEQLLEKVRRHGVNIDGNVCAVMVSTLVLEGLQRKLDPGYDVMQTIQNLLLKVGWAKDLSYTIHGLMAP